MVKNTAEILMAVVLFDFSGSVREQKLAVLVVSKILGPFANTLTRS